MKKYLMLAALAALVFFSACDDDDNNQVVIEPAPTFVELSGELTTRTLTADKKYLLLGQVFIRNGQVITIEPGTVIYGDKRTRATLIVDKGGQIIANGTAEKPIIMTSNQEPGLRDRGDWGGLVILGRSNTNQPDPAIEGITPAVTFGTLNNAASDNESSGVYKYIRVEFAGIELSPNNETNGITMGGVGRGTTMEYCMVSYGGDDAFEWFGGTVNGKYLISFCNWDDDFDVDYGWSGNVQFGLAIRYPGFADQSQSNGFETDNGPNDNDVEPYTAGVFSNITVIGPIKTGSTTPNANYAHALDLRRRTALSIFNSVFTGFPRGIRFNQSSVTSNYQSGKGVLANNVMVAPTASAAYNAGTGVNTTDVKSYWEKANTTIDGPATDAIHTGLGINPAVFFGSTLPDQYPAGTDFTVTAGTLATGASFANAKFNETNRSAFFNKSIAFRGAFGTTDWTRTWANFDPIDKIY
jgi:hypothetical protein